MMRLHLPGHYTLTTTERLNFQAIPEYVNALAIQLQRNGHQAFLVGGAVRDLLCGETPLDWDLCTDALPDTVETLFTRTVPTGKKFGTITVITPKGPVEVTTLREDLGYQDGRRPTEVHFTKDIRLDLARRDFTVNAIAYHFSDQTLIDPFDGRTDLRKGLLRTVGDPSRRFSEDGLRMFRFFRFLATRDFKADRITLKAIRPGVTFQVSPERISEELNRLLLGKNVSRGLQGLQSCGLLGRIFPELDKTALAPGNTGHKDLWCHLVLTTASITPRLSLRWAALLHDIAKPFTKTLDCKGIHFYGHAEKGADMSEAILRRLGQPHGLITEVTALIHHHMFPLPGPDDASIRRFISRRSGIDISKLLELRRADIVASQTFDRQTWEYWDSISSRIIAVKNSSPVTACHRLAINGSDIINELNLSPGPVIGAILNYLLERVLDEPQLNHKDMLLSLAAEYLRSTAAPKPRPRH